MNEVEKLKNEIKGLRFYIDLLISSTDTPIIRTLFDNNIDEETFNKIQDVFVEYDNILQSRRFTKKEFYDSLTSINGIDSDIADEIIRNMFTSELFQKVGHYLINECD